jgi:hypothetical protein
MLHDCVCFRYVLKSWCEGTCALHKRVGKMLSHRNPKSSTPLKSPLWIKLPPNFVYSGQITPSKLNHSNITLNQTVSLNMQRSEEHTSELQSPR